MDYKKFYNEGWQSWDNMIDNSPAPWHRRRIIKKIISSISNKYSVTSIADFGCGNGALLSSVYPIFKDKIKYFGFDISSEVIEKNKLINPKIEWTNLDINIDKIKGCFDIVLCSEVIEHLENWEIAIDKLLECSSNCLIITVPSGKLFKIDYLVGHIHHFSKDEIHKYLKNKTGIKYDIFYWGFPLHIIYKYLININAEKTYKKYMKNNYSFFQNFVSLILKFLFFLNIPNIKANQMFIVIKK